MMTEETWFVLYGSISIDGRGEGHYCGRTTDLEVAKQHYKNCADNPFNNGEVIAYTGTKEVRIYWETDWDKL